MEFVWGPDQKSTEDLKQEIITTPCLCPIDYHSDRCVILAINSSCIATGFIVPQLGMDNKWYLSWFSSITWNEREYRYPQAKIKIYSLWHALQAFQLYIIGVKNLRVEIDASYIKGMLNNPDIQPGATVNRWIIRIKLFQFELVHVPGCLHTGPDGLSCWASSPNDPVEEDDVDDWLDKTMSFAIVLMNSRPTWSQRLNSSCRPNCANLPTRSAENCPRFYPRYSVYLEDEASEDPPPSNIPH